MAGEINPIHQQVICERINEQKLFIDSEGKAYNFSRDLERSSNKKEISEKD